jgi:hypothetical protein
MATAISSARSNEIKLETNHPQTFALKYSTGKPVGQWGNVMFTAVDDRRLFLNTEDAGEFEHALKDLNVQPAEFIKVTRVKHGTARGGGFSIRVELVEDPQPPPIKQLTDRDYTRNLEQSIANAAEARRVQAQRRADEPSSPVRVSDDSPTANVASLSPTSLRFMGAYKDAVDALIQTQGYAKSKGLLLEIRCEDVRCLAATMMIQAGGR